jgi:ADP-heptose:LPS heptosyltransferase
VLLALPAIRSLRTAYGADEVGLLAARQVGDLLRNCHEVETVFPLESGGGLADLLSGTASEGSSVLTWLQGCGRVQCWMADRDGDLAMALAKQGVREMVISSAMDDGLRERHQSDRYLATAGCARGVPGAERPLSITESMKTHGQRALDEAGVPRNQPYAVIHPGSGSLHKCCPPAVITGVLDWLTAKGFTPLVVEGPADEQQISALRVHWPQRLQIMRNCELSTLSGIMANALLYVGHDSGITHLAAALAVPTIACFGPTDEARWGPRSRSVTIVRRGPCHCDTWEAVQHCRDKSCLMNSSGCLVSACEVSLERSNRNPIGPSFFLSRP